MPHEGHPEPRALHLDHDDVPSSHVELVGSDKTGAALLGTGVGVGVLVSDMTAGAVVRDNVVGGSSEGMDICRTGTSASGNISTNGT